MGGEGGGGSPIQLGIISIITREIIAATEAGPSAKAALPADRTLLSQNPAGLQSLGGINTSGSQSEAGPPASPGVGTGATGSGGAAGQQNPNRGFQPQTDTGLSPRDGLPEPNVTIGSRTAPSQQSLGTGGTFEPPSTNTSSTPTTVKPGAPGKGDILGRIGTSITDAGSAVAGKAKAAVQSARLPNADELKGLAKLAAFVAIPVVANQLNKSDVPKPKTAKSSASAARQRRADLASRRGFQSTLLTPLGGTAPVRLGTPTLLGG